MLDLFCNIQKPTIKGSEEIPSCFQNSNFDRKQPSADYSEQMQQNFVLPES